MGSVVERWAVGVVSVGCGAMVWWTIARVPFEWLAAMTVVGWGMVLWGWMDEGNESGAAVFRIGLCAGGLAIAIGVVGEFVRMWVVFLPAEPWGAVKAFPQAVQSVQGRIAGWLAPVPWVATGLAGAAACVCVREVGRMLRGAMSSSGKTASEGALNELVLKGAGVWKGVPLVIGGVGWWMAHWLSLAGLAGLAIVGWVMVAWAWFAVAEERETAWLRVSLYAGGAWLGVGVFQEFWAMWAALLPANPWRAAVALPGAVATVQERYEQWVGLTPWAAGVMSVFGTMFGFGVVAGVAFGKNEVDEGRKQSPSELFGRSRIMGRRMMRRMSRGGGVILGQMGNSKVGELVSYGLVGMQMIFAPPRTGKTALIAANLLAPKGKGFVKGSTVIVDPRGELYFVAAKRRQAMGRNVVLMDPFGEVAKLACEFKGRVDVPSTRSATFNPLDFIRGGEEGMSDIFSLLGGLLSEPARQGADNAKHFYESAKAECAGKMAWVYEMGMKAGSAMLPLSQVRRWVTPSKAEEKNLRDLIELHPNLGWGLPRRALERMDRVGEAERGSNFSSVANQLDWVLVPELAASTATSTFDPMTLADGNTDLFLVVPEGKLEISKAWLRMWVAVADAVPERKLKHDGITIVLDEAPRLGYLKPVMDALYMAAGKGIRFIVISQTESALELVFGREAMRVVTDLLEVLQILEFPRANPEFADRVSKTIGHATFVNRSKSASGTVAGADVLRREQSSQEGVNESVVKERLVTPEELMMLGVDEQVVLTNSKVAGREAMRLNLIRYWERKDMQALAAPNPYVLRMEVAQKAA